MANNFPNLRPSFSADFVNGIYVDPRITFSRAGTRTYFGREVVKAEENLFLNSATFPVSGGVAGGAVNNGDGTVTLSANTQTAFRPSQQTFGVGVVFTISVELSGTGDVRLQGLNGSGGGIGSITSLTLSGTPTRYTLTNTNNASGTNCGFQVLGAVDDSPATVTISKFQFELRSAATAYTPTTTQPITRYQRQLKTAAANEWPREFDPVTGECLGRSVWESRTNLLQRSEEFDNAYWTKTRSSILANQIIAPDGTLTADKLIENTDNNTHIIQAAFSPLASTSYTYSAYIKASERTFALIQSNFGGTNTFAIVNLTTGAVGSITGTGVVSTTATGNGWYRVSISAATTTTASGNVFIYTAQDATTFSYTGDGYSGIYIWGAQLESGAFASPYTPTVASQVTRVADSAVMTGVNFSSWFNPSEGALFVDTTNPPASAYAPIAYISDNTTGNSIRFGQAAGGNADFTVVSGGGVQASFQTTSVAGTSVKLSGSYKTNDFMRSVNGGAVSTDTAGVVPVVTQMQIGNQISGGLLNGYIKRLTYYPQALTSANLQAITR